MKAKTSFTLASARRNIPLPQEERSKKLVVTSLFSLLASLLLVIIFWKKLPPQVPIFYSRPWGEEQIASPTYLFLPMLLAFLLLIINLVLAKTTDDNFLKRVLFIGGSTVAVLASITVIRIVLLII